MESITIDVIRSLCKSGKLQWTNHMMIRLFQRNISTEDIEYAIMNGEIIEEYQDDYPYPSCLILGLTIQNRSLHIVCAVSADTLWLVTAYYPDHREWKPGFKTRKEH